MTLFVVLSDNCMSDARMHGLLAEVERLKERIEATQSLSPFDPFPPPYLVKKKLGSRQGRLLASRHTVGDHAAVVFLALLIRGSREYEDFSDDPRGYGERHLDHLVSLEELRAIIAKRTLLPSAYEKAQPTEAEYGFLYGAFSHHEGTKAEELVYETQEWVDEVSHERIANNLVRLNSACVEALNKPEGLHLIPIPEKKDWGIWAYRLPRGLLLISPSTNENRERVNTLSSELGTKLEAGDALTILRTSRKVYPTLILADEELWLQLEKEQVANMALSPEESEVLQSARASEHQFPLFINGRAGSGKSTILQYLFADLLYYYLNNPKAQEISPPVYLTASSELLRIARTFIERLLRSEATFLQNSQQNIVAENAAVLDEAFREFHPYLLSLVPTEERVQRFAKSNRIDNARFRRMWLSRFGKERRALSEFGPELSWHVIRTYIKGMSADGYLEPEDYRQLSENQITVTPETFDAVYNRVWIAWYQELQKEGLWDDQDLTRYVLDEGLAKPLHPGVFCDEAQDFTRLELELLLRLNIFSDRALRTEDISRVPFAFAGDPLQTLNPTGFRWDAIKASFVEKFILELDLAERVPRADLNYRELQFNYRSMRKIVRFSNLVQATRAALFQMPELRPQVPWRDHDPSFPVLWFRANDGAFWAKYRESTSFVIIVPCDEGEEKEFVEADPLLRDHIKIQDGVPVNVLSAARAKGCEYPAVIVYGFGAVATNDIADILRSNRKEEMLGTDRALPLQYFINRLYVAVSRPKRRLVIVDAEAGMSKLWAIASDEDLVSTLLGRIRNGRAVWADDIEGMRLGKPEELTRDTAVDPLENARVFEQDGRMRRDAFLLHQAAIAYRSGGDTAKATECRARALEYEEEFLKAGELYFEAGFVVPDGVSCLWRSGRPGWKRLIELLPDHRQIESEIELQSARTILTRSSAKDALQILERLVLRIEHDNQFAEACQGSGSPWQEALAAILQQVATDSEAVKSATDLIDRLQSKRIPVPYAITAQIYFTAGRYAEACQLWERGGATESESYSLARAFIDPYPRKVVALAKLGRNEEIVAAYEAAPEVVVDAKQAEEIAHALTKVGRAVEACALSWKYGISRPFFKAAHQQWREGREELALGYCKDGIVQLVREKNWALLGKIASSDQIVLTAEWQEQSSAAWLKKQSHALQFALVRALARSDEFTNASPQEQRALAAFLREFLRVRGGKWKNDLTIEEAGAALERGGRFTDAISFYEAIGSADARSPQRDFARRRWIICKKRQAEHEVSQGAASKARNIERQIEIAMKEVGAKSDKELGESYPNLAPLQMTSQVSHPEKELTAVSANLPSKAVGPDLVTIKIDPFRIDFHRKRGRCNIVREDTLETAFIKLAEKRCEGEVVFNQVDGSIWMCPSWKLTVAFSSAEKERKAHISFAELGVTFEVGD